MSENTQSKTPNNWDREEIIPVVWHHDNCDHYFEPVEGSMVKCRICGTGLIGVYSLQDGKPVI